MIDENTCVYLPNLKEMLIKLEMSVFAGVYHLVIMYTSGTMKWHFVKARKIPFIADRDIHWSLAMEHSAISVISNLANTWQVGGHHYM